MMTRSTMCSGCPFNRHRTGPEIDEDVRMTIARRIRAGERWVCHQTCDGAHVTDDSLLCAGAPHVAPTGNRLHESELEEAVELAVYEQDMWSIVALVRHINAVDPA